MSKVYDYHMMMKELEQDDDYIVNVDMTDEDIDQLYESVLETKTQWELR